MSDDFYAAEKLRQETPDAFDLLTEHEVSFHYESEATHLKDTASDGQVDGDDGDEEHRPRAPENPIDSFGCRENRVDEHGSVV